MACTIPITRSAGHLFLSYTHTTQGLPHKTSVRLQFGVDVTNIVARRADANDLASVVFACMTSAFIITGWGLRDLYGNVIYSENFTSSYLGVHTASAGMQDARSSTVTFTGKGRPPSIGVCTGPARMTFHTGAAFVFTPGMKSEPNGFSIQLDAVATLLGTHATMWADYYGNKAGINAAYPVQYNAAIQRRYGT